MITFVQNTPLAKGSSPLQSGLQRVCGNNSRARSHYAKRQSQSTISMTGSYGITLQTLIYMPNPIPATVEEKDIICNSVWKQVFGNAYVMESERAEAYIAESMYRARQIPLREFVRACAQSQTYKRRFFDCCGPYRAIELNFKHLLGRGPNSQAEIAEHVKIIAEKGFEAEINSYIDSMEYEEAFGDDYVPYMRFKGTYSTIEEFNRMCSIYSSPGTTDKSLTVRARAIGLDNPNHVLSLDGAGIPSKLVSNIAMNGRSSFVAIGKAIPSRPDLDIGQEQSIFAKASADPVNQDAAPRKRVEIAMGNYMYLTDEEAAKYKSETYEDARVVSYAEKEIQDAATQIAALQAKIADLSLIK